MEKVSIIVPVYKVEAYLKRCVDSLTGQTYPCLEIILVDDGSPDASGALCDKLAEQDDRIIVIHQTNQGVSAARNHGLDVMTGDWVCFCDGDDWFEPNFVEKMLVCAHEYSADYIICNYQIVSDGSRPLVSGSIAGLYAGCDKKTVIACGPTSSCTHMISVELFRKSGIQYPVGCKQYEELPVIPVLAKHASAVAVVDEPLYNYYQRGDGTSASNVAAASEQSFYYSWEIMRKLLGAEYAQEAQYHAIYALLYGEILNLCKQKVPAAEIVKKIEKYEVELPGYRENPYLLNMGRTKKLCLQLVHTRCVPGLRLLAWIHQRIVK